VYAEREFDTLAATSSTARTGQAVRVRQGGKDADFIRVFKGTTGRHGFQSLQQLLGDNYYSFDNESNNTRNNKTLFVAASIFCDGFDGGRSNLLFFEP
jgi:predicted P-loop ATPase